MKRILILFAITSLATIAFSQEVVPSTMSESSVEWVEQMYAEDADPGIIQDLFDAYYKVHPFIKNRHTQYFKRWMRESLKNNAPLQAADASFWNSNQAEYLAKSEEIKARRGNDSWVSLGPFDFDKEAVDRSYAAGAAHVYTVEQAVSNTDILYCGTANAGVWKSTDKGLTWEAKTKDMLVKRVYSVEIHYQNPDIVYFGADDGKLYKSLDGGDNWGVIGDVPFNAANHEIRDLVLHPTNPQILLLASDEGLYRSIDGGFNFDEIETGIIQEIEWHPNNVNIVYAIRRSSNKTQFLKSTDAGLTFTHYTAGWPNPSGIYEQLRTEIAVSADAPNNVYALATGVVNGGDGLYGIYVSNDAGETWTFTCCGPQPGGPADTTNINLMGWDDLGLDDGGQQYYDLAFDVSPTNADSLFVGGVNLWVSGDGGASFTCPSKWSHSYKDNYVHADIHDIRFYGRDIWVANDGGIFYSNDAGANFERRQLGIEGTDFWGFGTGHWEGDVMVGGTYHNGSLLKDNDVYVNGWISTDGGDNDRGFVNPGDGRVVYTDYNRKRLSGDRMVANTTFPYSNKPNTGGQGRESEIVFDADCYTCFYTGFEDGLWYTTDNGSSYELIHEFQFNVGEIEIPWSNPEYIYVSTYAGFYGVKRIWVSTNKGVDWTDITPDNTVFNSQTDRPYLITVDNQHPSTLYMARVGYFEALDGEKVFKTEDAGGSWSNITTADLDGELVTALTMQQGTDGGLWLSTRRSVYYKNNTMNNWQLYNNDLPAANYGIKMLPYYRKGKIRNAGDRSVYEAPFIEQSTIQAQISVETKEVSCTGESVRFADHSIMSENGATWEWEFEGAFPSTSNLRTPEVIYPNAGTYSVTLTVSDNTGSDTQTLTDFITVNDGCSPDTIPGKSVAFYANGDHLSVPPLGLTTNSFTVSAWINPSETLNAYSCVFSGGENGVGALNFRDNMELAYHWPGGQWWWESGLFVPLNEWSYVALVVTPNDVTVYLNGVGSKHTITTDMCEFTNSSTIGRYLDWNGRTFKGEIDELAIWSRSLSQDEIREKMHLTKVPDEETDLLAYYQFNNENGNATDRSGGKHASFGGGANRVTSGVAVGAGVSERLSITSPDSYDFPITGTSMTFAGNTVPNGELVVTRINQFPNQLPEVENSSQAYWIVNNYGTNATFDAPTALTLYGHKYVSESDAAAADSFIVYQRPFNSFINDWDSVVAANDAIAGSPGSISFINLNTWTSASQLFILNKGLTIDDVPDAVISIDALRNATVYPNPLGADRKVQIRSDIDDELTFSLYDNNGRLIQTNQVFKEGAVELIEIPTGLYFYRLQAGKYMVMGKLAI